MARPRVTYDAHDAPGPMRVSLAILALGTLTTWLLVGPLGQLLNRSLAFSELSAGSTAGRRLEHPGRLATWLALRRGDRRAGRLVAARPFGAGGVSG